MSAYRNDDATVYAVECLITGFWKIGCTHSDVRRRFRQLELMSPTPLELHVLAGVTEREAHMILRPYRLHGEWFKGAVRPWVLRHEVELALSA